MVPSILARNCSILIAEPPNYQDHQMVPWRIENATNSIKYHRVSGSVAEEIVIVEGIECVFATKSVLGTVYAYLPLEDPIVKESSPQACSMKIIST